MTESKASLPNTIKFVTLQSFLQTIRAFNSFKSFSVKPKLLNLLREALRSHHYSQRTDANYYTWVKRFIYFNNLWRQAEMAKPEINAFLANLAVRAKVSALTQNLALSTILFLCRRFIGQEMDDRGEVIRSRKPWRFPTVKTGLFKIDV